MTETTEVNPDYLPTPVVLDFDIPEVDDANPICITARSVMFSREQATNMYPLKVDITAEGWHVPVLNASDKKLFYFTGNFELDPKGDLVFLNISFDTDPRPSGSGLPQKNLKAVPREEYEFDQLIIENGLAKWNDKDNIEVDTGPWTLDQVFDLVNEVLRLEHMGSS